MGVYNNNKDGTRSTLANTIQVVDAPMEQFVSRGEFSAVTPNDVSAQNKLVAENEVTKAVNTMPTASASLVGTIVQYVGTTTANYTNGYFYKCVSDGAITPTYSWVEVISGGGGGSSEFIGTMAEWNALTTEQKNQYDIVNILEDGQIFNISIPTGGTTGQVLTKKSNSDYDTEWSDASGGSDNPYKNKNVVHMGDSWVHVYGIAEDAAQKVGYNVTVCGFQGTAISDYNTVFSDALEFSLIRLAKAIDNNDWSAQDAVIAGSDPRRYGQPLARLKAVDWSNTDVLVLSYGINDYGTQNPLGDASARDEESVSGALISAINILQSLNSSMEIIVTTPCFRYIPPDNSSMTDYTSYFINLDKYRNAIALSAKACAVKLIDMFAISGINDGNHALTLLSDGLHPTALGVDKWGTAFANSIEGGYVGAIDTNNTFTFAVDNLCFDSEKLDVHEKWNGSYTSGGIKYLCTRGARQYVNCILGMKHFDILPIGTVIKLEGYGKKIGETSHRIGFLVQDATRTTDLLDKYSGKVNNTTDSAMSFSFTTAEEYTDCWVIFYVKQMTKWESGKALVRDMKCTVTLPS